MQITFYAHASFRLTVPGLAVVTDPYTPGPRGAGFASIDEPADIVIMSSATDSFHSDPSHVRGAPVVVDAMTLPPEGRTVKGLHIVPYPSMESLTFDFRRDPEANAMYGFTLGGVRVLHMGDAGNPVPPAHLQRLRDEVDVLLALAGAHATIGLDDLDAAILAIRPRVIIPMHYRHARGRLAIEPVDTFLARHSAGAITRMAGPSVDITPETLPDEPRIVVLDQCR